MTEIFENLCKSLAPEAFESYYCLKSWLEPRIFIKWTIGGMTGGSCWGSRADEPVIAEQEPEFESLDKIIEELCPNITFLQYRRLCQTLIKEEQDSDYYYYGNYREKRIKSIILDELENYLREKNLWNG